MAELSNLRALFKLQFMEYLRDQLAAIFSFALPLFFLFSFGLSSTDFESQVTEVALVGTSGRAEQARAEQILANEPRIALHREARERALSRLREREVDAVVTFETYPKVVVRGESQQIGTWLTQVLELGHYRADDPARGRYAYQVVSLPGGTRSEADFVVPAIFALALLQLGLFGTGNQILFSRGSGVFRRLRSTPVASRDIILAHIAVRIIVAAAQLVLLGAAAYFLFDITLEGGLLPLIAAGATGAFTLSLLGYAIGGVAPTRQSGAMMLMFVNLLLLFTGEVFVDGRPGSIRQMLSYANPVSYIADSFRYAFNGQTQEFSFLTLQAIVLAWGLVLLVFNWKFFRYDMEVR